MAQLERSALLENEPATPHNLQRFMPGNFLRGDRAKDNPGQLQSYSPQNLDLSPQIYKTRRHAEEHCTAIRGFAHTPEGLHAPDGQLTYD